MHNLNDNIKLIDDCKNLLNECNQTDLALLEQSFDYSYDIPLDNQAQSVLFDDVNVLRFD